MSDRLYYYEDLSYYRPTELSRLLEGYYGDAVAKVTAVVGPCSDEEAMKIVDAVLGPLKLVPPRPDFYTPCEHTRFTFEGTWHGCTKNHENTEECGDPEHHRDGTEEWYEDDGDGRSFSPQPKKE